MRERFTESSSRYLPELPASAQPAIVGVVPRFPNNTTPWRGHPDVAHGSASSWRWLELSPDIPAW